MTSKIARSFAAGLMRVWRRFLALEPVLVLVFEKPEIIGSIHTIVTPRSSTRTNSRMNKHSPPHRFLLARTIPPSLNKSPVLCDTKWADNRRAAPVAAEHPFAAEEPRENRGQLRCCIWIRLPTMPVSIWSRIDAKAGRRLKPGVRIFTSDGSRSWADRFRSAKNLLRKKEE